MKARVHEKEKAIALRRQGLSYKDILKQVPVAKSSISLWLHDLPLTAEERKYLKNRTDKNISRGRINAATALHRNRLLRDEALFKIARTEFVKYKRHPLFFAGIALYWAEGSKRISMLHFTNSDVEMVNVMLLWIEKFCGVRRTTIGIRLYTHKPFAHERSEEFWSKHTHIPMTNFKKTIYKPSNLGVKKRPNYKGCVRIEVPRSTNYFRKIQFWQNLMVEHFNKG